MGKQFPSSRLQETLLWFRQTFQGRLSKSDFSKEKGDRQEKDKEKGAMREPQGKNKAKENSRISYADRGEKQASVGGFMPLNLHSELTSVIDLT